MRLSGGHLRGSRQGEHALRHDQDTRAAKLPDTPSNTPSAHPAASVGDQCHPGSSRGVWHRGSGRRNGVDEQLSVVADANDKRLPEVARACWAALGVQLGVLKAQILEFDRMINTGIDQMRRVSGWTKLAASVQCWPRLWSLLLPTQRPSDRGVIYRPGSG